MSEATLRAAIKREAEFWLNHQAQTHYAEVRPIPLEAIKAHKFNSTDCSGLIIGCYFAAGAPDPSGSNYSGAGFTGSFLDHLHPITQAQLQVGDIVVFGPGTGAHASMVIEAGDDPTMSSNGFDGGPIPVSLSAEIAQRRAGGNVVKPIHYLTAWTPKPAGKAKRYVIYIDGKVSGHTNHYRTWLARHRPYSHGATNVRIHKRV